MKSHHHLTAWSRIPERARIVAICDPDTARAEGRSAEFGIPHVYESAKAMLDLEALDAIDIAAPRDAHATLADLAAERGIDALCQKPLASSFGEAETLVRRVDNRMRLMAHENWQFRPAIRALGDAIYHVHAKDTHVDPTVCGINGRLETKPGAAPRNRAWNYVTLGYGHGETWWRQFCAALKMVGYNDVLSIEHEDMAMSPLEGVRKSVRLLREATVDAKQ